MYLVNVMKKRRHALNLVYTLLFSISDSSFLNKAPSKLAAAIFASARTELGVNHALWPKRLEDMFGYPLVDLLNLKTNISE